MKCNAFFLLAAALMLIGCGHNPASPAEETTPTTLSEVYDKQDGPSMPDWIAATLGVIEHERWLRGDSLRLSRDYYVRLLLQQEALHCFNSKGNHISLTGSPSQLLNLFTAHGALSYDGYHGRHGRINYNVLARKVEQIVLTSASEEEVCRRTEQLIDHEIDYLPNFVFLYGAEYTPMEFGHSILLDGDYTTLTPDDNTPTDTLLSLTRKAIAAGHHVVWQGKDGSKNWLGITKNGRNPLVTAEIVGVDSLTGDFLTKNTTRKKAHISVRDFRKKTLSITLLSELSGE